MKASLVYDGSDHVIVPLSMGTPSLGQLQGTVLEQLGELASRICYDSLGCGRSSAALHKHILEVINLSVYEHLTFTVVIKDEDIADWVMICANRKGVFVEWEDDHFWVTTNFRALIEWERKSNNQQSLLMLRKPLLSILQHYGSELAPQIIPPQRYVTDVPNQLLGPDELSKDQAHITLWLYGSRGFTHEQVRHRFAMSQRSTRYVDESDSEYVVHPLIEAYFQSDEELGDKEVLLKATQLSTEYDRRTYNGYVTFLESYLTKKGLDRTTARKQARGAARGFLGNALASEMLFTAPISGWEIILGQRLNKFADAEIRAVYADVLDALKQSVHGHFFDRYRTVPSPDGLGVVLGD